MLFRSFAEEEEEEEERDRGGRRIKGLGRDRLRLSMAHTLIGAVLRDTCSLYEKIKYV